MFSLALLPIGALLLLLFVMRWPLFKAAPSAFVLTVVVAVTKWSLPLPVLGAALLKGLLLGVDVMLIVFGAVYFLKYLREIGSIRVMEEQLRLLSSDRRVQAILLAWLFGGFIEGVSGFGTPAAIVAPFLVSIGFSPVTAILVALSANSTAVAFGAVGTPVRIGFAGLDFTGVPWRAALINVFAGFTVPVVILAFVAREENRTRRWQSFIGGLPWAFFAGAAFLLPYALFSLAGYEFPSLLGGAVGMALGVLFLRSRAKTAVDLRGLSRAFAPYGLLLALLIMGKFAFGRMKLNVELGGGLMHSIQVFNPGFAFLTAVLVFSFYHRVRVAKLVELAQATVPSLGKTAVSIFFIGSLTYTMMASGGEQQGMLETLAAGMVTPALPLYSTLIGAIGAFLAGSATVSNLLFGELQMRAAQDLDLSTLWILAFQLVGAGAGNMIALSNVLAVQAAVGIEGQETVLLRRLIWPCLFYLIVATVAGLGLWRVMR